ncbi:hypothetical protein AAHB53_01140 [Niallia circulans]
MIENDSFLPFIYLFIAYSISVYLVANKYVKMVFRYGSYLSSYFFLAAALPFGFAGGNAYSLAFMVMSMALFGIYFLKKKRKNLFSFSYHLVQLG